MENEAMSNGLNQQDTGILFVIQHKYFQSCAAKLFG